MSTFKWFLLILNGFFALTVVDKSIASVNMGIVVFITLTILMEKNEEADKKDDNSEET